MRRGDLAFVTHVDPVRLEDVFHLEFENRLIGEHPPMHPKQSCVRPLIDQSGEIIGCRHFVAPVVTHFALGDACP